MELDEIAIGNEVIGTDLLAVEYFAAPDACELQFSRDVLVHEFCDVKDSTAPAHRERFIRFGRLAGGLGVDTHDLECTKQEWP